MRLGFAHLAFGMNLDDPGEFRPGQKAAALHHVVAPLVAAELTKAEVRVLAREAGLSLRTNQPARVFPRVSNTAGRYLNLSQVEQAEMVAHLLGFPRVRVRHHGDLARVEIARDDLPRALTLSMLDRITALLRPLGFLLHHA